MPDNPNDRNTPIQAPNCIPPKSRAIGNNRTRITWINPGGQIKKVVITTGPDPEKYFTDLGQDPQNRHYQMDFSGGAPADSTWTYAICCEGDCANIESDSLKQGGFDPELTNGQG